MRTLIIAMLLLSPIWALSQLYDDASSRLPDDGARRQSMDVRAVDIDGDGDLDIVLANEFQANNILINDGQANFSNARPGSVPAKNADSEDVAIADYDGNGTLDLIFCSEDDITLGRSQVHEFYWGDGQGNFQVASFRFPDSEANAVVTADINGDSLPDVLFGNNGPTTLFLNNGDRTFSQATNAIPARGKTTQDLALADVDGDGDLDLFEGNENGNLLFINQGNGTFQDESLLRIPSSANIETRKVSFGDMDGDGDLDIFLSNVGFLSGKVRQNRLYQNNGEGRFRDVTANQLPQDTDHTLDAIFEDVDLDGDLDIFLVNAFGGPVKVYMNDGAGTFQDGTQQILGQNYIREGLGIIAADFNGDGYRDIYICNRNLDPSTKDLLLIRRPVPASLPPAKEGQGRLFPNPAREQLFWEGPGQVRSPARVFDLGGQLLHELPMEALGQNRYGVNLEGAGLAPGTYIFDIQGSESKLMIY